MRDLFSEIGDVIELRRNPVTGGWVIISTDRAKRPMPKASSGNESDKKDCPFCPGNESMTPPEVFARRGESSQPDTPGWDLRVIPNKYPALKEIDFLQPRVNGPYEKTFGFGVHEVVIETPVHENHFLKFGREEIRAVLQSYRERLLAIKKDRRLRYAQVFKNHGVKSGASLPHEHSQILALPFVPSFLLDELKGAKNHFDRHGRCVFCDIFQAESGSGERLVCETPGAIAIEPFASQYSYETWILPRTHRAHFEESSDSDLSDVSSVLCDSLKRLSRELGDFSFNMVLHTAPFLAKVKHHYHWHFEITTRFASVAGFERGTGVHITAVPPEISAKRLRES